MRCGWLPTVVTVPDSRNISSCNIGILPTLIAIEKRQRNKQQNGWQCAYVASNHGCASLYFPAPFSTAMELWYVVDGKALACGAPERGLEGSPGGCVASTRSSENFKNNGPRPTQKGFQIK